MENGMGEDDQDWTETEVHRSSFGSLAIRNRKKRRKTREGAKPIGPKAEGGNDGGSGAPQGRSLIRTDSVAAII